jgi:hypothetical protein
MNSFLPEQITEYAREAQDILSRKKLINKYSKDVSRIVKSLYTHLDYLKPDLTAAQNEWKELCIISSSLSCKNEYCKSTYPDNPICVAEKIKQYFLLEL